MNKKIAVLGITMLLLFGLLTCPLGAVAQGKNKGGREDKSYKKHKHGKNNKDKIHGIKIIKKSNLKGNFNIAILGDTLIFSNNKKIDLSKRGLGYISTDNKEYFNSKSKSNNKGIRYTINTRLRSNEY